jgi:hypothetical protein
MHHICGAVNRYSQLFSPLTPYRTRIVRNRSFDGEPEAMSFQQYRRKQIAELRPYVPGEPMDGISVAEVDRAAGSPKAGDMIARNPSNHADQWLVAATYFADNFEPML